MLPPRLPACRDAFADIFSLAVQIKATRPANRVRELDWMQTPALHPSQHTFVGVCVCYILCQGI